LRSEGGFGPKERVPCLSGAFLTGSEVELFESDRIIGAAEEFLIVEEEEEEAVDWVLLDVTGRSVVEVEEGCA